jgi:hypothetical protein
MNSDNNSGAKLLPVVYGLRTSIDSSGALGVLFDGFGREFAVFAEGVSPETGKLVIPEGINQCKLGFYHHGNYPTFEIIVPGHSEVLFHKGNFKRDSKACVIVAEKFGLLDGVQAVEESKEGFEEFWNLYKGFKEIQYEVINFPIGEWAK